MKRVVCRRKKKRKEERGKERIERNKIKYTSNPTDTVQLYKRINVYVSISMTISVSILTF